MTLDDAIRLTEIIVAFAFALQSAEYCYSIPNERRLFFTRLILSLMLLTGIASEWICLGLLAISVIMLHRFQGPYNGGSDRMGILLIVSLSLVHFAPSSALREYVFGYLAIQVILSYFVSGWVKVVNHEWRRGQALRDVFLFSAYPVSENLRKWAEWPRLLLTMSWCVILFELLFPLALFSQASLVIGLALAASFHLANACLFGLNRFFWIWLAAYPSIFWFQDRVFG